MCVINLPAYFPCLWNASGKMTFKPIERSTMADQFQVKIVWQSDQHLVAGRRYKLRYGEQLFDADITSLKYREISLTGEKLPAKSIGNNETVIANISLS